MSTARGNPFAIELSLVGGVPKLCGRVRKLVPMSAAGGVSGFCEWFTELDAIARESALIRCNLGLGPGSFGALDFARDACNHPLRRLRCMQRGQEDEWM